jgi:HlyD family secretion protein
MEEGAVARNHGNGKSRRKRWVILAVCAVVLTAAVFLTTGLTRSHVRIERSKITTVERGDLAKSVVATGKIEPYTKVEIKSKASGIIKTLLVNVGDPVREGQVLIELDKEQLEAHVREAKAQLQGTQANLLAARAAYEKNRVEAEGPEVPFAEKNLKRARELFRDGLIPQSSVEDAEKVYELARNKQQTAVTNLGVTKAQISQAEAQVAQATANQDRVEDDLRNSTIRAPFTGVVLSRDREVGDAVSSILVLGSSATLIMNLGDIGSVYVKGKVDESDVGKVYLDQAARITVESFKDKKFFGKVTKISPMGVEKDNVTTFEVRVSIDNRTGELKANMTANAEIVLEEHTKVLMVPEAAIIYGKDRSASVEVPDPSVREGKRKVSIQAGISNGAKTEVLKGLQEGQEVVLQ